MRVKGPGGPRGTASTTGAKASAKTGKVFSVKNADATEDSTEKARAVRGWLLEELGGLAKDVKDGKASKEEATRKFVHLVVKEKMKDSTNGEGARAMEDSIGEMCESDPQFVSRLHNELMKMARS